jgi:preprotein translocase subunit SecG
MQPGAGSTLNRLVLIFGNIWIIIQFVLDVEAGRRTPEREMDHHKNMTAKKCPTMI